MFNSDLTRMSFIVLLDILRVGADKVDVDSYISPKQRSKSSCRVKLQQGSIQHYILLLTRSVAGV